MPEKFIVIREPQLNWKLLLPNFDTRRVCFRKSGDDSDSGRIPAAETPT
jgi:hypothetical protein